MGREKAEESGDGWALWKMRMLKDKERIFWD